ncbi:MAG: protein kinase [Acidobacteriota bacterium]
MNLEPGRMLAHYRLVERLGEGAMGVVWKAIDTTLDREVAIKILPEAFAADPERLARFEREAKLLASLNHPNIAAVYGLHTVDGVRFLALELVRGRTLREVMLHGLLPGEVLAYAEAIAGALAAAHRKHVTHRDLKPENIMIDEEGRPKVLDFGLAKLTNPAPTADAETLGGSALATKHGMLVGTIAYMSPEQAQGKAADPRSDIFALGIVIYEMVTGKRPFRGDDGISILTAILRDRPESLTQTVPATPAALERIVDHCLEKDPNARYSDASGLRDDLRSLSLQIGSGSVTETAARGTGRRPLARRWIAKAAILALVLALLSIAASRWWQKSARERWVRQEALPKLAAIVDRIQGLEEGREAWDAYLVAREIEAVSPDEPLLAQLRPKFSRVITIDSEPPGAAVTARYYDDPRAPPVVLGRTPLVKLAYPRGFTRIELTKPGRRTAEDVIWNLGLVGDSWSYRLPPASELPDDMAYVPAGSFALYLPGLDSLKEEPTAAFLMDRNEVTQRDYKRFVDAGGYREAKYWQQPFIEKGRTLSWQEAVARFVDRTGKPGPAGWEVGGYADGADNLPVSGVSWYEAAAYAEWAGKSLPTIFHWNRVAFTVGSSHIAPAANLAGKELVPVGSTQSVNRFGVHDLAGNVREWVWNSTSKGDQHFILGGGWNDPDYAFVDGYAQPAFDRSLTNGFRCIRRVDPEPNLAALERTIDMPFRDFLAEKPTPDAVYAQYVRQFAYDKTPLDARIEETRQTPTGPRQKISFQSAYGGDRMLAYLFLPPAGKPPYQVVVVFPGSGSIDIRSSDSLDLGRIDFLPKAGRAVLWPIYKGTYERGGDLHSDYPTETASYRDYVTMWGKDLARSLDYVETRPDLDSHRIAYYGLSWGAALGAILPAVEPRIRANILYVAGLNFQRALPEADQVTYIGHVHQPTLMLNGELDFFFPAQTSQLPMFKLLGTPPGEKERLVFPGGHSVPRTEMIKESLRWLDKYLGPVDAAGAPGAG